MTSIRRAERKNLPGTLEKLVGMMVPEAIRDDVQNGNVLEMIDTLMALRKLTTGQARYLETLVQLVETYEARHHSIETNKITGIEGLKHLLKDNGMNASDLARLLDIHPSMGSKILQGDRSLTVPHLRKLAAQFKVSPALFLD
jgi:antitoxin component HigA of HigAB toxin-antitoxin module